MSSETWARSHGNVSLALERLFVVARYTRQAIFILLAGAGPDFSVHRHPELRLSSSGMNSTTESDTEFKHAYSDANYDPTAITTTGSDDSPLRRRRQNVPALMELYLSPYQSRSSLTYPARRQRRPKHLL